MWLSGQQKRPADAGEGQTGIVTMSEGGTAVLLDSERRGLHVYSPGGYHWTPAVGQRVLVIQGKGEIPCVVGAREGGGRPKQVTVEAAKMTVKGDSVAVEGQAVRVEGGTAKVKGTSTASVEGERVDLNGEIYVNGQTLEEYITMLILRVLGGMG